jgi:hypothetical protein
MPSKRDVLGQFSRDELLAAADHFDLTVADRRVKQQLVDAVGSRNRRGSRTSWQPYPATASRSCVGILGLDEGG